jgi:hypothetical protein
MYQVCLQIADMRYPLDNGRLETQYRYHNRLDTKRLLSWVGGATFRIESVSTFYFTNCTIQ